MDSRPIQAVELAAGRLKIRAMLPPLKTSSKAGGGKRKRDVT